jgi:demethylmenaquinone methyltransferase/2-methoxy-6-polyprenyl-1,4-benzoquinol methylase
MSAEGSPKTYQAQLLEVSRLTEPAIEQAVAALGLPAGSVGLDAGCGIGLDTLRLARAVGRDGRVIGCDISQELLDHARRLAAEHGERERVEFRRGELAHLPFTDGRFDWVFCKDVLWGHRDDPVASLREMTRVLRAGGQLALAFWCSQVLLPGQPALEARLMAAFARAAPYQAGIAPERHFMRALGWMQAAGLSHPAARTFAATAHAPLGAMMQGAVRYTIEMFFDEAREQLGEEDRRRLERLIDPGSDEFLPAQTDYCCAVTYVVFQATKPSAGA